MPRRGCATCYFWPTVGDEQDGDLRPCCWHPTPMPFWARLAPLPGFGQLTAPGDGARCLAWKPRA